MATLSWVGSAPTAATKAFDWRDAAANNTGITTVEQRDVDPLVVLRQTPNGLAAREFAIVRSHTAEPTENQVRVARRVLDRLVARNVAHRREPVLGGPTGTTPARDFAVAREEL